MTKILNHRQVKPLLSDEHFSVDGTASTTDPKSRLHRKAAGREAELCYMGHVTMENRHGLAVAGTVTKADGTAERRALASHAESQTQSRWSSYYQ